MAVYLYGNVNGTYQKPNIDLFEMAKKQNNQPVESFTNRLSRVMQDSFVQFTEDNSDEKLTIQKKGEILLEEFRGICDEITSGYEEGNRVRFIEDSTTEDGYRKLSKEDELSILLSEFSAFVEFRFGKEHQEQSVKVTNAINDFQKIKQELGYGDIKYYEPEYIPDGFVENLKKAANQYVDSQK